MSGNSYISMMRQFLSDYDSEREEAHDLWTWLPSYKAAEKSHGDYACEFTPPAYVLHGTISHVLAYLINGSPITDEWIEEWCGCPCDDCDNIEGDVPEVRKWLQKLRGETGQP